MLKLLIVNSSFSSALAIAFFQCLSIDFLRQYFVFKYFYKRYQNISILDFQIIKACIRYFIYISLIESP